MQGKWVNRVELLFKSKYQEFCLVAYSYVANLEEAEDIVQDIFIALLIRKDHEINELERYVKRWVKNASLNRLRATPRIERITDTVLRLPQQENQLPISSDEKIRKAIQNLPLQCRRVFELCALEGHQYNSAARTLNISVNTVKTHMKKAYSILRMELQDIHFLILFLLTLYF